MRVEKALCPRCACGQSVVVLQGKDYLHGIPGDFTAARCARCGLWFQDPRPANDQLAALYPSDYLPHAAQPVEVKQSGIRPATARYLRKHLGYDHLQTGIGGSFDWRSLRLLDPLRRWHATVNLIPRYVPGGKLLEIGCASGSRLLVLRRLGWEQLCGVELVPAAAEAARSHSFHVECGPIEETLRGFRDDYFDVIISSMVIEHLLDPFQVVEDVARTLKPGGQFLFSTIIRDSLDARMYGQYWSGFDFPRHMIYFRKSDIFRMLAKHFDDVECVHQSAPIDFVRPATWRHDAVKRIDRIVLALAASPAGTPLGLLLAWLGLTCRVSFRCRRRGPA